MQRGYTKRMLIDALKLAKANPNAKFKVSWALTLTSSEYLAWFLGCLNTKINRSDAPTRKTSNEYQSNLRWDRQQIGAYLCGVRSRGKNLLRTSEMRKRYPHINNQ